MAQIIDGKFLAQEKLEKLKTKISKPTTIAVILVGKDEASAIYVRNKIKKAEYVGINAKLLYFENISESDLIKEIKKLNSDASIDGYFIQAPLPKEIDFAKVCKLIKPEKDIDGLNPANLGLLSVNGKSAKVAATPLAVVSALQSIPRLNLEGKKVTIIGRSQILGKPLAYLLTNYNSTVTLCHSKTVNLSEHTQTADIVVAATGIPDLIAPEMVSDGVILIDCGAPKAEITQRAKDKSSYYTPVPGGIGPLTIACLLENSIS